ncbi:MAG: flavodoxin domain-containing protein, partial [Pseudomonadota bacterium]
MEKTLKKVPYIPEDAPFSGDQKAWLGGFLAGLHSRVAMGGDAQATAGPAAAAQQPIDILYGTQTGSAEALATDAAEDAKSKGYKPRVAELDEIEMDRLAGMETAVIVVSTYGEGEMPDNAQQFWEALSASTAPRLENLKYGVLALGDTSYEHFCQAGKLIDTRLEQLGATRMHARVDCDVDYEDPAAAWISEAIPVAGPAAEAPASDAPAAKPKEKTWGRKNPYTSRMADNRVLSGPKSAKEIRHIAFELGEGDM